MKPADALRTYLARLSTGRIVLWCYLIWYAVIAYSCFDPSPALWINSLGISLVVGFALMLSVSRSETDTPDHWQTMRLFLMPFCVSSFSSLIKGRGFFLIAPATMRDAIVPVGACTVFVLLVFVLKRRDRPNHA
jgi:hypothetical protein